jgi:hypothetical protein
MRVCLARTRAAPRRSRIIIPNHKDVHRMPRIVDPFSMMPAPFDRPADA